MTRVLAVGLALLTLLVGSAAAATTPPTFLKAEHPFLGNNHIVADFNGDARPDLAGTGGPAVRVQLNNGSGAFGASVDYPTGGPAGQDLAAGDFNEDGRLDVVVTINDPQIGLAMLIGNGDGTFAAPVTYPNTAGADAPAIVVADFDNDGNLDVVAAHQMACYVAPCVNSLVISVWMGNGDGTLDPSREVEVGRGMAALAVGDFNRDGNKDLAVAGDSGRLYRLHGVGDGTFVQQPTLTITVETGFVNGSDVDVADFNGDAIEDLVVAMASNGSYTVILIGNGDGSFRPPHIIQEPDLLIPQYQAVADFNGDGFQDLALSLGWGLSNLMEILNGNGDGTFQPRVMYLPPPPESSGGGKIVAADLNGDNKPDITLGRTGAFPGFLVLLNSTGAAPPATPSAPALLSPAQDATVSQPVTFDWRDVSGAATYRIQVDDTSDFTAPVQRDNSVTVSQFTTSSLPARRLWWRVRAINAAGTAGPWSTVRRFTPTVAQPAPSPPALSTLTLTPTSVVGGSTAQGTATLTSAAPSGGAVVTLSSGNTAVATVPASVTVAAGGTSATFTVTTSSVASSTTVPITGTYGGNQRSASLTVTPPAPPPAPAALSALTVTPTSVVGGSSSQGRATLTSAAPSGGAVVTLSSGNPGVAAVPASVTVAAGATSATFTVTTTSVASSTPVTISGDYGGSTRTATLTVTPPAQTAALTVTATGRSGERVTSSPAGINVPVGSSGSASFTVGASITLSATNGRDVIWSGACSSGGNKTRSCTFTLNGAASVTANVQ